MSVSGSTEFSRRNSVTSLLRDMVSSSVFVWLYLTIHFSAQDWIASRSRFNDSATSLRARTFSTIDHSVLSSAKTSRWLLIWLKRSLMKTRKSRVFVLGGQLNVKFSSIGWRERVHTVDLLIKVIIRLRDIHRYIRTFTYVGIVQVM